MTPSAIAALVDAISPRAPAAAQRPARKGIFRRMIEAMLQADRNYRDDARLRNLPDHVLRDIGLSREDLYRRGPR